ncbi:MAG: hypothetical protein HQL79_12400, partial [Magnetococcales bacterium]|nr:hypothetical protein [Magnetococcales bacterium]
MLDHKQINDLLNQLRNNRFRLSVDAEIRVHQLQWALLAQTGEAPDSITLAPYLAPLLCISKEEQLFFRDFYPRWLQPPTATDAFVQAEDHGIQAEDFSAKLPGKPHRKMWYALLGILVLLCTAWYASDFFHRTTPEPTVPFKTREQTSQTKLTPLPPPPTSLVSSTVEPTVPLNWSWIVGTPLIVAFATTFWLLVIPFARARRLILEQRITSGREVSEQLLLRLHGSGYNGPGRILSPCPALRQFHLDETADLDVPASVAATVIAGGYPTLVYGQKKVVPGYLILAQRKNSRDHLADLASELAHALSSEGIPTTLADFSQDPRWVRRRSKTHTLERAMNLEELIWNHEGDRLIIVSSEEIFFDPLNGNISPWVQRMRAWPVRILLTPDALGNRKVHLEAEEAGRWVVLPADDTGVKALTHWLQQPEGRRDGALPPTPVSSSVGAMEYPPLLQHLNFIWRRRLNLLQRWQLMQQLRRYLGAEGFAWLQAAAVAPFLHPGLTRRLGTLSMGGKFQPMISAYQWNALVRLPWFRSDALPDWLRLHLLMTLGWKKRKKIQDYILEGMHDVAINAPQEDIIPVLRLSPTHWWNVLFPIWTTATSDAPKVLVVRQSRWFVDGFNLLKFPFTRPDKGHSPVLRLNKTPVIIVSIVLVTSFSWIVYQITTKTIRIIPDLSAFHVGNWLAGNSNAMQVFAVSVSIVVGSVGLIRWLFKSSPQSDQPASNSGVSSTTILSSGNNLVFHDAVNVTIQKGLSPEIIKSLGEAVATPFERLTQEQKEIIQKQEKELGVGREAISNFLAIIREKEVPPEQWPTKLKEIAERHIALLQQLQALPKGSPKMVALKEKAQKAIAENRYDDADASFDQLL